jgi:hypothetical protein
MYLECIKNSSGQGKVLSAQAKMIKLEMEPIH